MSIRPFLAVAAIAAVAVAAPNDGGAPKAPSLPQPAASLQAFVDPGTSDLAGPLPGVLTDAGPDPALFVPVEIPLDGGGVRIDLDGHFESQLVATVGQAGTLDSACRAGSSNTPSAGR